jgi:microcystin-dependent protein
MPYGTSLAATGGSADAVVVSHTHTATVTDPGHNHTLTAPTSSGDQSFVASGITTLPTSITTSTATTGISVTNASTGVSGTNANLPPYLGINFIIKT